MSAPPWMPLYVADYLADTGHLSTVEHGAYILLIMHYWQNEGLPIEDEKLARIVRLTLKEWRKIRATIADFFDKNWCHDRIDREIVFAVKTISKRSTAGKAAAIAKATKRATKANQSITIEQPIVIESFNDRSTVEQPIDNDRTTPTPTPVPEEEPSEPKTVLQDGPGPVEGAPPSEALKKELWSVGRVLLGKTTDLPEKQIGGFVGECLKKCNHDLVAVLEVFRRARTRCDEGDIIGDPRGWIMEEFTHREPRGPPERCVSQADIQALISRTAKNATAA